MGHFPSTHVSNYGLKKARSPGELSDSMDIMDIDFDVFINGYGDSNADMASVSSPSTGLHSRTPFKTPGPSRPGTVPTESPSTQQQGPSQNSSVDEFEKMLDSINSKFKPGKSQLSQLTETISHPAKVPSPAPSQVSTTSATTGCDINGGCLSPFLTRPAHETNIVVAEPCGKGKGSRTTRRPRRRDTDAGAPLNESEAGDGEVLLEARVPNKRGRLARMVSDLSDASGLNWGDPLIGSKWSGYPEVEDSPSEISPHPTSIENISPEENHPDGFSVPPKDRDKSPTNAKAMIAKDDGSHNMGKRAKEKKNMKSHSPIVECDPQNHLQLVSTSHISKKADDGPLSDVVRAGAKGAEKGRRDRLPRKLGTREARGMKRKAEVNSDAALALEDDGRHTSRAVTPVNCGKAGSNQARPHGNFRTRVSETGSPSIVVDPTDASPTTKLVSADQVLDDVDLIVLGDDVGRSDSDSPPRNNSLSMDLQPTFVAGCRGSTRPCNTIADQRTEVSRNGRADVQQVTFMPRGQEAGSKSYEHPSDEIRDPTLTRVPTLKSPDHPAQRQRHLSPTQAEVILRQCFSRPQENCKLQDGQPQAKTLRDKHLGQENEGAGQQSSRGAPGRQGLHALLYSLSQVREILV